MEKARKAIELAFCFGGWVHGGYVRDMIVNKKKSFEDVDLCFADTDDVDMYIASLNVLGSVDVYSDSTDFVGGEYGIDTMERMIKVSLDDEFDIDICVVKGGFDAWIEDRSTDLSCNLFYKSYDCPLGLRYIPDLYKHMSDPAEYIIELTQKKRFDRISNEYTVQGRVDKMERRGWTLWNEV